MVFDLHCDALWRICEGRARGEQIHLCASSLQVDEQKLKTGGYTAQCFAVYIPNRFENSYERCLNAIKVYHEELKKCSYLLPMYEFNDFEKNKRNGGISAVLTMEDACPIGEDLDKLRTLYGLGVRMICLTHNLPNAVGYPNCGGYGEDGKADFSVPEEKNGLTEFGFSLIEEMNRLGVIVDVSHLSDKGFFDVVGHSKKPVVASHSNARGLCAHTRNLTDEMLKALAEKGGVMGINYEKSFLHTDKLLGADTVPRVVEHIQYIAKRIGVEHIALGSDFDGIDPDIALSDASRLPELLLALEKAGFTQTEIEKITHKNALRVFKDCLS